MSIFGMFKSSARQRFELYDITAYVGKNGTGKTMFAINDLLPTLQGVKWTCNDPTHYHTKIGLTEGYRNVLSTVKIMNPETKEQHALLVPYLDHNLLVVAEHSEVLLDEITAIYPSRGFGGLPNDVAIKLNQLRKPDLKVSWTAPNWQRADVILREVTEQVVSIRRFGAKTMPGRVRKTFSYFMIRSFNGDDFKNWINMNQGIKIKPETYELYHRRDDMKKGYQAQHYYNSFAEAYTPVTEESSGSCLACGGYRQKKKCLCNGKEREENLIKYARAYWSNQLLLQEEEKVTSLDD